jgi:hypothetical protein
LLDEETREKLVRNRDKRNVPDLNAQPVVNYTQESFRKYGNIKVHNFV